MSDPVETKPAPTEYRLTTTERIALQSISAQFEQSKAAVSADIGARLGFALDAQFSVDMTTGIVRVVPPAPAPEEPAKA